MKWIEELSLKKIQIRKHAHKRFKEKVTKKELVKSFKGLFKYYETSFYYKYLKEYINEGKYFLSKGDIERTEEIYYKFFQELFIKILENMVTLIHKNIEPLSKVWAHELEESLKKDDGDTVSNTIWIEFINKGRWKPSKIEKEILSEFGSYFCSIGK